LAIDNEGRAQQTRGVFCTALRSRSLALVELSWLTFNGAEWGVWLALMLWAYTNGGAAAVSLIIILQLVPCILVSPYLGAITDRARAYWSGLAVPVPPWWARLCSS
jgi:hypothetical protein